MMVDFMIISLPRSGSTWAANWLTTDHTLCLHDPLWNWHYSDLDQLESSKRIGIADTGIFNFTEWLNAHPARKIILHRPLDEINASLAALGLPEFTKQDKFKLGQIKGQHHHWLDLWNNPADIYEFLLRQPFDAERHRELALIEMQPKFAGLEINPAVTRRLRSELLNAIKE